MHRTEGHSIANRSLWRSLIYLGTVGLALALYRAVNVPLAVAIIVAFVVTIPLATVVYLLWVRDHDHRSNP